MIPANKILCYIILALLMHLQPIYAQQQSSSNINWVKTLEEAKYLSFKSKKPIFINCHAAWAHPCIAMEKNVFSNPEFGNWLQKRFIPLYLDMKSKQGKELAKEYQVNSYAHFLIINNKGELIHRISGGSDIPEFKEHLSMALNKKTSLAGTKSKYESDKYSKSDLLNYLNALLVGGVDSRRRKLTQEYLSMLSEKDYSNPKNWKILRTQTSRDGMFYKYVISHKPLMEKNIGVTDINRYLEGCYASDILSMATRDNYNSSEYETLKTEIVNGDLNQNSICWTVLEIARLKGERKIPELIEFMNQNSDKLATQTGLRPLIEESFYFTDINDKERLLLLDYLKIAAKREKGPRGQRIAEVAQSINFASEGIRFNKDITFKQAIEIASQENKLIFLDCYTSWCGPCKYLAKTIFIKPEVGNFFNSNFINIKIDMEVGEGKDIAKKYDIKAFPTLLFLNSNEEIIIRQQGALNESKLIELGEKALKAQH